MNDIVNTIEVLAGKIRAKEEEANKLKKLVNELCGEAEVEIRYPDISESASTLSGIRSDQFYGQTLTAAIRNYLDRRKASNLGAASMGEIYKAIRDGGYKFETKSEENAKISVGNALRKTSSIFHRLPNGQYGLLSWYETAKARSEEGSTVKASRRRAAASKKRRSANGGPKSNGEVITNKEIRDLVLAQDGEFQASGVEAAIKAKFPSKELPKTKIPSVLFILKKKGILNEVSARSGKKGAVYSKAI
jgi:hypothetical protein